MRLFASRLAQRRAGGHRFLVGDQLSALDIYWATFISRIQPLQRDLCPMPEQLRASFIEVWPRIRSSRQPWIPRCSRIGTLSITTTCNCHWICSDASLFGERSEFVVNSSAQMQSLICPLYNSKAKSYKNTSWHDRQPGARRP